MKYEIFGNNLPAVTIHMDAGESIFTQSGGLAWMSDGINMETNMKGGLLGGLSRLFTGESLFIATFTAERDGQKLTLSSDMPGEIRALRIDDDHHYVAQKGAFLGATEGVTVENYVNNKLSAGLFGGEGFILQQFTGDGLVFCELDGAIRELDLQPGETVLVSSSHVAIFEDKVKYDVQSVKGFKNILFGGEGLFLTTLTGPGKVWLQTMTAYELANRIIPYIPRPSSNSD